MARFVMVHGAFAGAWAWGPLASGSRRRGTRRDVRPARLGRATQTPVAEVRCEAYADRLCQVLGERQEPAVVVPNSMGGVVATQAAARCPERVAAIVYVAAFVPQDGESLIELTERPEGEGDQVQANIVVEGDPPVAMPDESTCGSIMVRSGSCYKCSNCGTTSGCA